MNLWKQIAKFAELSKGKLKVIPENEKDVRIAEQLTNMINYAKSNDTDAEFFCCNGHQFDNIDICQECIKDSSPTA